MGASYLKPGLTLQSGAANDLVIVKALQHDLRKLGYLRAGIDGRYGDGTAAAVKALQYDLLHNSGQGSDGPPPVVLTSYNQKPGGGLCVAVVDGVFNQDLAGALAAIVGDERIGLVPSTSDPKAANAAAMAALAAMSSTVAPPPFIVAIVTQESSGCHFHVPGAGDEDTYVSLGLDRNDAAHPERITSRGYGFGQYTYFHHPLSPGEIASHVADPAGNIAHAFAELRDKFDLFVLGKNGADDRAAEYPGQPLRLCRYNPSDQRYFRDCHACATAARKRTIANGTPVYGGAALRFQPTQYYPSADYSGIPDRTDFSCDWPYAARRYNGGGVNSYHYQTHILRNLMH